MPPRKIFALTFIPFVLFSLGCNDDAAGGEEGAGGTGGTPPVGGAPSALETGVGGAVEPGDATPGGDEPPPEEDAEVEDLDMGNPMPEDAGPVADVQILPDVDVGPLDGPSCDPRLNAAACAPGSFCVHVPGAREYVGACQAGDQCVPGDPATCPDPARPHCALRGGGTFCTAVGALEEGESCVDELDIPQPCEEGLLCNNSVCQTRCDPEAAESTCEENWRCEDITSAIGVKAGFCQPPACDWFTARGCMAGQKCSYTIRNDAQIVGSCTPLDGPGNSEGAPCDIFGGGGDNCAVGLVCTGPPDRQRFCRYLCDTGGYQAPCPERFRCTEALATQNGRIRGLGICVTNQ
jgi:hypothetical protein